VISTATALAASIVMICNPDDASDWLDVYDTDRYTTGRVFWSILAGMNAIALALFAKHLLEKVLWRGGAYHRLPNDTAVCDPYGSTVTPATTSYYGSSSSGHGASYSGSPTSIDYGAPYYGSSSSGHAASYSGSSTSSGYGATHSGLIASTDIGVHSPASPTSTGLGVNLATHSLSKSPGSAGIEDQPASDYNVIGPINFHSYKEVPRREDALTDAHISSLNKYVNNFENTRRFYLLKASSPKFPGFDVIPSLKETRANLGEMRDVVEGLIRGNKRKTEPLEEVKKRIALLDAQLVLDVKEPQPSIDAERKKENIRVTAMAAEKGIETNDYHKHFNL